MGYEHPKSSEKLATQSTLETLNKIVQLQIDYLMQERGGVGDASFIFSQQPLPESQIFAGFIIEAIGSLNESHDLPSRSEASKLPLVIKSHLVARDQLQVLETRTENDLDSKLESTFEELSRTGASGFTFKVASELIRGSQRGKETPFIEDRVITLLDFKDIEGREVDMRVKINLGGAFDASIRLSRDLMDLRIPGIEENYGATVTVSKADGTPFDRKQLEPDNLNQILELTQVCSEVIRYVMEGKDNVRLPVRILEGDELELIQNMEGSGWDWFKKATEISPSKEEGDDPKPSGGLTIPVK